MSLGEQVLGELPWTEKSKVKATPKTKEIPSQIQENQVLGAMLGRGGPLLGATLAPDDPEDRFSSILKPSLVYQELQKSIRK